MNRLGPIIVVTIVSTILILVPAKQFNANAQAAGKSDFLVTGPYDVVENWPEPLNSLPAHEKWSWGSVTGVFGQNPNRVFVAMRGELPVLQRPATVPIPQFGPSLSFPIIGLPFRNSSVPRWKEGADARWEHCIFVVDAKGKIIESWLQWDSLFSAPHRVTINPYDPEKHVWVADDGRNQIFEFTNDGKTLVRTMGEKDTPGRDEKHFAASVDLNWLPDGTMLVADDSRIVKFDKAGKFLMAWGEKGNAPNEKRPGYFNDIHAMAIDNRHHIYVYDRNRRIQIFDENGKFLGDWYLGDYASVDGLFMTADQHLCVSAGLTNKVYKFDLSGQLLSAWGTMGSFPGALWGPHSMSVDQENNLYIAEATNGRVQKFRPKKNTTPALLVGQPIRAAWND